ncbi:MAG: nicotinate-nucleotide adenylyltransferase [Rhodothermales bacterium]
MRVGIFGGTFNPPHFAHLILAEIIREQAELDRIRWIPTHTPPHKTAETPARHRLAMTRLAIAGNDAFEVSEIELERGGPSYTVDTLEALQRAEPDVAFSLLIGGDSLADFMTWRRPDEIVRRAPLIVYRRPGVTASPEAATRFADRIRYADAPAIDLSSQTIRERVQNGQSIRYLVPDSVRAYITRHGLYR